MNFIENFVSRCEARGETPSHALEAAGLSKSLLSKLRKHPDRTPNGETLTKIANYFGCTVDDLLWPQPRSTMSIKIQALVDKMNPDEQERLYRLVCFVWSDLK